MRLVSVESGLLFCLLICAPAFGWGADGHRLINVAAMKALPADLPDFLRSATALKVVAYLGPEADRQKGAGTTRDKAYDPGHFLDLSDDGTILGGPRLDGLPETLEEYDSALRAKGHSQYKAGSLPYSIIAGYQLLVKDFAWYRAYAVGEQQAKADDKRQLYAGLKAMREAMVLRDIGYWSHFVADGSQPLHVTVHYNGWGEYPNPEGFTEKKIHGYFETRFVMLFVNQAAVDAAMPAPRAVDPSPFKETADYLKASNAQVVPLYRLYKDNAFLSEAPAKAGIAFTVAQLAHGAGELRDLIVAAWAESASAKIGWPEVPIKHIEAGWADPPPPFGN